MSKKKRVRRDIEKLYRMGRHWDLLRLIESEGLLSAHAGEHKEAWKAVIKEALRQGPDFDRFCREVETVKSRPNDTDLRFLMCLKGYIDGRCPAGEVIELKGLTPDAERLRVNFAAFAPSAPHMEKLAGVLAKFVREPDKITRRYFQQVADLVPWSSLAATVAGMGVYIPLARGFNGKAAVAKGWDGIDISRLGDLDMRLKRASLSLPGALRDVLLHPFVHNIAVMCRRLAPDGSSHRAEQLVRAIPFLLPTLAGEKLPEVKRKLLADRGEWMDGTENDIPSLRTKLEGLSIEEKVTLLNRLRLRVRDRPSEGPDFEDLDLFDDDDDDYYGDDEDDEDFEDGELRDVDLARTLLLLHRSILGDISRRLANESQRDRKELVRVMEPVLFEDFDFIFDTLEDTVELQSFLDEVIRAGCAGTRMGLLAVLVGARFRNADLRKRAEKHLDQSTAPTPLDMDWLAREWGALFYPTARSLKPLLVRYRNNNDLMAVFTVRLCTRVEVDLVELMVKGELSMFPLSLFGMSEMSDSRDPGILRRELQDLTEFEVLDPVRHFLRCYPDDRMTIDGHLCWLNTLHSTRPEASWEHALEEVGRYREMASHGHMLFPVTAFGSLLGDKVEALLLFVQEHQDELSALSIDTLEPLLYEVIEASMDAPLHQNLLIRIEKQLAARVEAGEASVRRLVEKIRETLKRLAKPQKKTRKTRKWKR